jgi:hypothetical protein
MVGRCYGHGSRLLAPEEIDPARQPPWLLGCFPVQLFVAALAVGLSGLLLPDG